jgi:Chaperone of endosialidase
MARYNTSLATEIISGAQTLISPAQGGYTEFTGTGPYTVTIPAASLFLGQSQSYFNNSTGAITLQVPSGVINGPGASATSSIILPVNSSLIIASDGTNYSVITFPGGNQFGVNGTFSADLISTNTGTTNIYNTTTSTINFGGAASNINIGAAGSLTTLNGSLFVKGSTVTVNSATVRTEDKNIEIGYVNPVSYGAGNVYTIGGALGGSTTFTSITGVKVTSAGTYSNVSQFSTSGSGSGATFNITTTGTGTTYTGVTTITLVNPGSNYAIGDTITIGGASLGGTTSPNNLTFTVSNVNYSPWIATITGMTSTTNLIAGQSISATNGIGSLGSGGTSYLISNVVSGTSIQVTVTGGTTPVAGSITAITPGSADTFANGGGIILYGSSNHQLLYNTSTLGPTSGGGNPAWVSTEGFLINTTNTFGIQNQNSANFNILTNGQATGTVNIATNAGTGNLFTAASSGVSIGASGGTCTIGNTNFTVGQSGGTVTFNGITTFTMNSVTAFNLTGGGTMNAGSTYGYFSSLGVGTNTNGGGGTIYASNNIVAYYSDDRLKTRLGKIEDALAKLETLNGFYFEANQTAQDLGYTVQREVGVSAQEVNAILPEIIKPAPIDAKYMTVQYEKLLPLVIEAIKELSGQVKELKAQINKE